MHYVYYLDCTEEFFRVKKIPMLYFKIITKIMSHTNLLSLNNPIIKLIIMGLFTISILSCLKEKKINGAIFFDVSNSDSIIFSSGLIDSVFYEKEVLSSWVRDSSFIINTSISYPHLYYLSFKNERDSIPFRGGEYFIDSTTDHIEIFSNGECSLVNGKSHKEFKNKFIPFFYKNGDYNCASNSFQWYRFLNEDKFDKKLLAYIDENPDSYVALWFLIERFSIKGHSELYDDILSSFSDSIKDRKLWKHLSNKLRSVRIKKNKLFPTLYLKNLNLETEKVLISPKAKYTLIDYWFSSCKPCIKSFPILKRIYDTNHKNGFNVISISVDKTKNIDNWKKLIKEQNLNWQHFLDENSKQAKLERIITFPTTFLLDSNGIVIKKNIPLHELDIFLKENLIKNGKRN